MKVQEKYSNIITLFLQSHPAISPTRLEEEIGLPDSTIRQALAGVRLIPVKHIFPILCHLAGYGLEIDGYTLTFDPEDGTLTGRKWLENVGDEEANGSFEYIVKEARWLATDYADLT